MSPDEILAMAKEARVSEMGLNIDGSIHLLGLFERFAALVAAHEREQCALECDRRIVGMPSYFEIDERIGECAAAIRARGNP